MRGKKIPKPLTNSTPVSYIIFRNKGSWGLGKSHLNKPKRNQGCPARTAQKAPHLGQATEIGSFSVTPGQVNL